MTTLLIGTYPAAGAGTPAGLGEGIWRVELDDATGALADAHLLAALPSPSFLATTAGRVHAVLEAEDGVVVTLAPTGPGEGDEADHGHAGLTELARAESGGAFPCHVLPLPGGDALAIANYGSGTLGVAPLDAGAVAGPVDSWGHAGHGPHAERQDGPHAHFVALAPGGRHLLVVDLGTDEMRRFELTDSGVQPAGIAATLPPGTGPRHVAFAAGHAYVAGELDARVHVLAWDEPTATGAWVGAVPAVVPQPAATDPAAARHPHPGADGDPVRPGPDDLPSHIAVDGGDVLVAVRGADVLTRYRVGPDGGLVDGRSVALGGHWPRHFAVVGGWTIVALERGHALVSVGSDGTEAGRIELESPACVVPVR